MIQKSAEKAAEKAADRAIDKVRDAASSERGKAVVKKALTGAAAIGGALGTAALLAGGAVAVNQGLNALGDADDRRRAAKEAKRMLSDTQKKLPRGQALTPAMEASLLAQYQAFALSEILKERARRRPMFRK